MCFAPQRRAPFRHVNFQKWSENGVSCTCSLPNVFRAATTCTFSWSQLQKVLRMWQFLTLFTPKCASRHNGGHLFDMSTSKSGPRMVCFAAFDLQTCFAPQRRALLRPLHFQKCSEAEVFYTFWLGHVLRTTMDCNFWFLIWPAGSAHAALASLLFDTPEPQITEKTHCFATFLHFRASASSFLWLSPCLIFVMFDLPPGCASSWLCFSICP